MKAPGWFVALTLVSAGWIEAEQLEPPLRLTLDEAVRLALSGGRDAIGARLTREDQELSLESAQDRYIPSGSIGASARKQRDAESSGNVDIGSTLRIPTGGSFRLTWRESVTETGSGGATTELTFSHPLLKGFGRVETASLRRAQIQDRIATRAFRDRVGGIVVSVVSAVRNASRADRRVAIARSALQRAKEQLQVNETMVEADQLAPQDLVQSEAVVADREYSLIDSENAREIAYASLVDVLDLEEGVRIVLEEETAVTPVEPDFEASLEIAFAHREDWLRAELGVELAQIAQSVAKNNRLWDVSLGTTVTEVSGAEELDYRSSVNLAVPLLNTESRRSLIRAENDLRRAEMQLAETRQAIGIAVRRAVNDVEVALRRIDLARTARDLAERKLEVERSKLNQGLSSSFQIGRFENDLIQAENRELDATVGYRNARTALSRTLGTTLDDWGIGIERVGR